MVNGGAGGDGGTLHAEWRLKRGSVIVGYGLNGASDGPGSLKALFEERDALSVELKLARNALREALERIAGLEGECSALRLSRLPAVSSV